jgi:hypothetical protein
MQRKNVSKEKTSMNNNLINLFYVCSAQPDRVVMGKLSITESFTLLGLSLFLLGLSDSAFGINLWPILVVTLMSGVYVANKESRKNPSEQTIQKIMFVVACAPIPSVLCYVIEAHLVVTLGMMMLCCYTILNSGTVSTVKNPYIDQKIDARTLRKMRATSQDAFVSMGPSIGNFADKEIPAWFIDATGVKHNFVGICPSTPLLLPGQSFVAPGLIYSEEVTGKAAESTTA